MHSNKMQVNSPSAPCWETTPRERQTGNRWAREMESHRLRAEMNEQEWENAIEASSFCWLTLACLCQPRSEAQISIRSASLCAWQQVYRGSFLNQASPTAGRAPDKRPTLKGIAQPTNLRWETAETDEWTLLWKGRAGHGGQGDSQRERN